MCKVKCEINDLPLHFIFDTGASDVTMSSVEATFMLKNGYLCESDLSGKQYYRTADGSIAEGVKVSLRNVKFAGLTLSNVKAGIVTNQSAPLLLGQSVLERLGRIEIDNDNMLIRING
jgi:clan AA aspartic protease (TIGR02281 family)